MNDAGRIGFLIRGEYDNTETYDFLDVVYYDNSSYVAKKLTVGNPPADNNEYWQALTKVPGSTVLGVKGSAESTYRTGNVNLTAENVGAINKGGDSIPGRLNFVNSGDIRFVPPDVTGDHARGVTFMDKNGTDIWGGIGVLGRAGSPQYIYLGAGSPYPWDSSQGLYISNANILWKGAKLVTENSGIAKEAIKATRDGNGNDIGNTYTKKNWQFIGRAINSGGNFTEFTQLYSEFLIVISDPMPNTFKIIKTYIISNQAINDILEENDLTEIELDSGNSRTITITRNNHYNTLFTNNTYNSQVDVYAR